MDPPSVKQTGESENAGKVKMAPLNKANIRHAKSAPAQPSWQNRGPVFLSLRQNLWVDPAQTWFDGKPLRNPNNKA